MHGTNSQYKNSLIKGIFFLTKISKVWEVNSFSFDYALRLGPAALAFNELFARTSAQ